MARKIVYQCKECDFTTLDKTQFSYHGHSLQMLYDEGRCDCRECSNDPDEACSFDCDYDDMCLGCKESSNADADKEFEFKKSQGLL